MSSRRDEGEKTSDQATNGSVEDFQFLHQCITAKRKRGVEESGRMNILWCLKRLAFGKAIQRRAP